MQNLGIPIASIDLKYASKRKTQGLVYSGDKNLDSCVVCKLTIIITIISLGLEWTDGLNSLGKNRSYEAVIIFSKTEPL